MKKLNLLEPALVKGYVKFNNVDQQVSYLQINENMNKRALAEDIASGANQFAGCLEAAEKGLSNVVVIHAKNEEDGLMAVNYLSGICNDENGGYEEDELEACISEEADYQDLLDEMDFYFDEDYDSDSDDDCDSEVWEESVSRVPIVSIMEIDRYACDNQSFFDNNFIMTGMANNRRMKPYWFDCTKEKICIKVNLTSFGFFGCETFANMTQRLNRFKNNDKVFLLVIDPNLDENEEGHSYHEQGILNFVLENTADMIRVVEKEEKLKDYRIVQFENWLKELGMRLISRFPKHEIVSKILKINNPNKSEVIKMVLKYVKKESKKADGEVFTKEDFAILSKFQILGLDESSENKYAEKLNTELIGLENVKEQVKNIIQIMKYNKYRKEKGISDCKYHNVHLLIGAPGTAKTTVAQIMGNMMREENLLQGNRFACVNGADLKGLYVGHSAPKVQQLFHQNDIILIDEAYSLVSERGDSDSFSQEAMAQLILEIEEHGMEKLIMFAGYGGTNVSAKNNKMKMFIDANPGLKSRINSTIYFDSYTPEQMVEIVHIQAKNQGLSVDTKSNSAICEYFKTRVTNPNFGNGREARSLLENALSYTASRIMSLPESKRTKKMLGEVTYEDMKQAITKLQADNAMQNGKDNGKYGFI